MPENTENKTLRIQRLKQAREEKAMLREIALHNYRREQFRYRQANRDYLNALDAWLKETEA